MKKEKKAVDVKDLTKKATRDVPEEAAKKVKGGVLPNKPIKRLM